MVVLTFWLSALAPMVSQALAAADPARAEICSSATAALRRGDAGEAGKAPGLQHLFQHCAMCSLHAHDLALPPDATPTELRQDLGQAAPERFLSAAATAHAWRSGQARAPPL